MPMGFHDVAREGARTASDAVIAGGLELTPKFAIIAASASGNTQVVAAVTDKKVRILNYNIMASGTSNAHFQSATTGISGLMFLVANVGKVCGFSPLGWFQTTVSQALNINLSVSGTVGGELVYIEV